MDAFLIDCVRSQVDSFLAEITRIEGSEFPYQHSADCVRETKELFFGHRQLLAGIDSTVPDNMVTFACDAALADVQNCMLLLGFLLRSTNVRNAFEAYGPLLRLSIAALGDADTKLVLSSEWSYSPFTYIGFQHLPGVVLIGLPATESSNPLLLPLAGHELGHNAWRSFVLEREFAMPLKNAILREIDAQWASYQVHLPSVDRKDVESNLIAHTFWSVSYAWALSQCEEYFCDAYGVRLFGESFPHAFAFLLAPFRSSQRVPHYPSLQDRARAVFQACENWQIPIRVDYEGLFAEIGAFKNEEKREAAQLQLADSAARSVLSQVVTKVSDLLKGKVGIPNSEDYVISSISRFALRVPAENAGGIAHLLNAAWRVRLDPRLIGLDVMDLAARAMLAEIVWKSIEIDEIENRLSAP